MNFRRKTISLITLITAATAPMPVAAVEASDTTAHETLDEVVVTVNSARRRLNTIGMGSETIELSKVSTLPAFFGENDIIKTLSLLPGVHAEGEGSGGFVVRGGSAAQNLVMLDGITLYNPSHVMGIFSIFNDDALGRATLHKGPVPASYGEATSSALDVGLRRGDFDEYHGSGSVGILAAKINVGGPIVKDKISFAASARRSYFDVFLSIIPKYRHIVMNLYDVTAKLSYTPRAGDFVDVSFTAGRDNMAIGGVMGMYWGNIGASASWLTHRRGNLKFTTTGAFTLYDPDMSMTMMESDQRLTEFIHNYSVDEAMEIGVAGGDHKIRVGLRSELLRVKSAEFEFNANRQYDIRSGWQNAVWGAYEGAPLERLQISGGLRLSLFSALTGGSFARFAYFDEPVPHLKAKSYLSVEPRVNLKYLFSGNHNIKAGVAVTSQSIHAIRANNSSFPFDRYAISSAQVKPERCTQYCLGYSGMTETGDFDWQAEVYWKEMDHVYDYKDGLGMFSATNLESIILGGRGRSYGLELMVRKNTGPLTGSIAYTLSKTLTRIDGINGGRWYDASTDRRHNVSATASYRFNPRWNVSAVWTYTSGQPLTAPDVKYELSGTTCYYYSARNAYRTPANHHLDISATYTHHGKRLDYSWAFGIYNLYCRQNPYVVYFQNDPTKPSGTRAVQQSLYGLLPSVSYTLTF